MAGLGDFLNPILPGEQTFAGLQQTLGDPRIQAALMSVGGALGQPMPYGQTSMGHLLQAVGAGGESVRANEALDLKQREQDVKESEAESRSGLRESQATLAESRANVAGARSDTAAESLKLRGLELDAKNERNRLGNRIRFQNAYLAEKKQYEANFSKDPMNIGKTPTPFPPFEQWMQKYKGIATSLGFDTSDVPGEEPAGAEQPGAPPVASRGQSDRKPGNYTTPKGVLYWDGAKWLPQR